MPMVIESKLLVITVMWRYANLTIFGCTTAARNPCRNQYADDRRQPRRALSNLTQNGVQRLRV